MPFVTRAEWGARKPKSTGNAISSRPKGVAVHYEGPKMGSRDHSLCAGVVRGIQTFHMDSRGWADIAYTFIVCEHGYVFEGRGVGKGSAANGTTQANLDYYAVCGMVGEGDAIPARLTNGIRDGIDICRRNGAGNAVVGHRDLFSTKCPGDALYAWAKGGAPRSQTISGGGKAGPVHVPAPVSAPVVTPVKATSGTLTVDGKLGPATYRALQRWAGVTADGVMGPATRKAVQRKVGVPADGMWGPQTWRAIQRTVGSPADGIPGPATYRALQAYLNKIGA